MHLLPDAKLTKQLQKVIKIALSEMMDNDETYIGTSGIEFKHTTMAWPDPDEVRDYLEMVSEGLGLPFAWNLAHCRETDRQLKDPVLPYIHSAALTMEDIICFNLDYESIEDNWDYDEFLKYTLHVFNHEAVHFEQAKKKYSNGFYPDKPAGIAAALIKAKGDSDKVMFHYLADKDEIMAHAFDLASEMMQADNPQFVLRDPEGFIDFLPTWQKYRYDGKYLRKDKVIRRLLRYTAAYMEHHEAQ